MFLLSINARFLNLYVVAHACVMSARQNNNIGIILVVVFVLLHITIWSRWGMLG